jgi:asparagine synthase (glutamine-hydrolysing)
MPAALLLAFRPTGLGPADGAAFETVAAAFPERVRAMRRDDLDEDRLLLRVWSHDAGVGDGIERAPATGGWAAVLGNPSSAALAGVDARAVPRRVLELGAGALDALSPPFALALRERAGGPVHVAVDRCGIQHLYVREGGDGLVWLSSSLLALMALGGTVDEDAVAEWLGAGHFVSERTIVREVRKVGAGTRLRLDADGCTTESRWRAGAPDGATDAAYRDTLLAAIRDRHHEPLTVAELTGGLDSRLVLAGRIAAGLPATSWTIGDPRSAELRTVARLQRIAGFDHIAATMDPARPPGPADLVREMHRLSDGEVNALEYAPLLHAFGQVAGRWHVSLSGAGGETGRGYYYAALGGDGVDLDTLTHKLASATGAAVATLARPDRLAPLRGALEELLASSGLEHPANRLEEVYLRGRMQRFAGRNTSTTGYFFRQALPFFDNAVVAASLGLDPSRKAQGAVMRDAVAAWAPALAAVPLDSGMSVAARSWAHPVTQARWAAAMGRKAAKRYGGAPGRRIAGRPPVPWDAVRADGALQDLVRDTLLAPDRRTDGLLDRAAVNRLVERGLGGQDLYALGLVLTLELTLQRLGPS